MALGWLATVSEQYAVPDYGETINGDRDFAQSLTAAAPGGGPDQRVFHDLVVYPALIDGDDGPRAVHVVAGEYISPGGTVRRRCYVAGIPYRPVRKAADGGPQEYPSVRDYLGRLAPQGVSYRYAWWREPRWMMLTWTFGTVGVVGFLLPALVNYWTYGAFRRPAEEKGVDLSKVGPASATTAAPEAPTDWSVPADDDGAEQQTAPAHETAPPLPALRPPAPPLEVVAVEPGEAHEYGAGPEDFYPTERKAPPREP